MTIEIRDTALEARLRKQLQSTGSRNVEELLTHLLETQEEQDRWLSENREAITGVESSSSTVAKEFPTTNSTLT
jgi:hypothetical protein